MIIKEDLAYIAGFFDGEGSIYYLRMENQVPYSILQFSNTDTKILEWIKSTFGIQTKIAIDRPATKRRNATWKLYVSSQPQVKLVLNSMLPYLRVKKTLANEHLKSLNCRIMKRGHELPKSMQL